MATTVDPSLVQYLGGDTNTPGEYVRTTDQARVQWVNPSNLASVGGAGSFELYLGDPADYVPVITEAS